MRQVRHRRRGITLIELVAVMAVGAIVTGIATTTIIAVAQGSRAYRNSGVSLLRHERLLVRFREDIRSSRSRKQGHAEKGILLQLDFPDGSNVEYRQQGQDLVLTRIKDQREVGRQVFGLEAGRRVAIDKSDQPAGGTLWTLLLTETVKESEPKIVFRVVAAEPAVPTSAKERK